ncbi:hypothetical protein E3N88_00366 [Mikania micrantha]|uniref:Uncharacterized protein n=1 Tax=Mikania micrantha TaxID=192012 RepID=A0A5N6Q0K7_9ASTR|nr:hypothetical protein E3N88_00366 [Mikania micrantha]
MENLNQISAHTDFISPILKQEDERRRRLILPSLLLNLCYRKENNWLHIQNFEFLDLSVKRFASFQSNTHSSPMISQKLTATATPLRCYARNWSFMYAVMYVSVGYVYEVLYVCVYVREWG